MSNIGTTFKRATGSGSLHGNDWLNIAIAAAAAATGAGAAGVGPLAGMFGSGAGAAGAGAGGMAAGEGLGMLGAEEAASLMGPSAAGSGLGWTSGFDLAGGGDVASAFGGGGGSGWVSGMDLPGGGDLSTMQRMGNMAKKYGPGLLNAAKEANASQQQQPVMPGMQRPSPGPAPTPLAYPNLNMSPVNSAGSMPGIGGMDMNNPVIAQAFQDWLKKQRGAFV